MAMTILLTAGGLPMRGSSGLLVTSAAHDIVNVTSAAELMTALGNATGGERIKLAAGNYGIISIQSGTAVNFPTDVMVVSADRGNIAVI